MLISQIKKKCSKAYSLLCLSPIYKGRYVSNNYLLPTNLKTVAQFLGKKISHMKVLLLVLLAVADSIPMS